MASDPGYEVLFMPWAGLGQPYRIGPFSFVPWSKMEDVATEVKAYLDPYFLRHVDHFGRPVDSITLLVRDGRDFSCDPYPSYEHPAAAVDAMYFAIAGPTVAAAVSENNDSLAPPTADGFELLRQNFRAGDSDVKVCVGGSSHVAKISTLTFPQPWDLGGTSCFPCDELLEGLGKLFDPTTDHQIRDRIFRSLEWFRLAHVGGPTASLMSRIVMISTALEILLQIPDGPGKTERFIDAVEGRLNRTTTLSETRSVCIHVGKNRGKPRSVTHTLPGWWANKFYDLRSRIVHGDDIVPEQLRYEGWVSHQIVAAVVFWQCIKYELFNLGFIGQDIRDTRAGPYGELLAPLLVNDFFGYDTHRTLKWIA